MTKLKADGETAMCCLERLKHALLLFQRVLFETGHVKSANDIENATTGS